MGLEEVVPRCDPWQLPLLRHQSRKQWTYPELVLCSCREDRAEIVVGGRALLMVEIVEGYRASQRVRDREDKRANVCSEWELDMPQTC